ncbi:hypothetical protein L2728_21235 [Shewanella chilikensis]|uniref:hypothetical protein n=1 Tax=Shewanella chilikensis TaxID=558541 RepID=UPI0020109CAA|nr:hypothetical protein [Shewanella chilikensis]MCL1164353.1 hypothetical protein [Shewanella chilikensis]
MIGDNPAARLLAILELGIKQDPKISCREIWRTLLNVENGNDALLMSRLGKLMELPEQAIQIIKKDLPNQKDTYKHWSAQVHKAFSEQNLNGPWQTFRAHIDGHTLIYLRLTADLMQTKSSTSILTSKNIQELKSKVDQLLSEVLAGDLEHEIKQYIARYLQKILISIDEYRISGALPIIESVEGAFGHAFFDENYRQTMAETEIGTKIVSVLSALASAVTVALGAPQLPQAFQLLIERLK